MSIAAAAVPGVAALAAPAGGAAVPAPQVRIPETIPVRREAAAAVERNAPIRALVGSIVLVVVVLVVLMKLRPSWAGLSRSSGGRGLLRAWMRAQSERAGSVRLVQSIRLTPRATVHVIRWDDRELLVGCTEQSVSLLDQRKPATEPAGKPSPDAGAGS